MNSIFLRLPAVLLLLGGLCAADTVAAEAVAIPLPEGVSAEMESAAEEAVSPQSGRAWVATFVLSDSHVLSKRDSLIIAADLLFEQAVLVPADVNGHTLAVVRLRGPKGRKNEEFRYARQDDKVWLRQAGKESWKRAERRDEWSAPNGPTFNIGTGSDVTVEYVGEIVPPAQRLHALGIVMHSSTPVSDRDGKYREVKALYERLDKKKLSDDNFDYVAIVNFEGAALGRFYVRQSAELGVTRRIGEEWPDLPETAPGDTPPSITSGLEMTPGTVLLSYSARDLNSVPGGLSPSTHSLDNSVGRYLRPPP